MFSNSPVKAGAVFKGHDVLSHPSKRLRQAPYRIVRLLYRLSEPFFVTVAAVAFEKMVELRLSFFKKPVKELVHRIFSQESLLGAVTDLKIRFNIYEIEKSPYNFEGKSMKGAYVCR